MALPHDPGLGRRGDGGPRIARVGRLLGRVEEGAGLGDFRKFLRGNQDRHQRRLIRRHRGNGRAEVDREGVAQGKAGAAAEQEPGGDDHGRRGDTLRHSHLGVARAVLQEGRDDVVERVGDQVVGGLRVAGSPLLQRPELNAGLGNVLVH